MIGDKLYEEEGLDKMTMIKSEKVKAKTLEKAFPNLMVTGSRLWIELAFLLNGREKTKTRL